MRTGSRRRESLTIARMLVITCCVAVAVAIAAAQPRQQSGKKSLAGGAKRVRASFVAPTLVGLALSAALFAMLRRRRGKRVGPGGRIALALGTGILLIAPYELCDLVVPSAKLGDRTVFFLAYAWPMLALTLIVSAIPGRLLNRRTLFAAAWTERYGLYIGLLWALWGAWNVYLVYGHSLGFDVHFEALE